MRKPRRKKNVRGLAIYEWDDLYGSACSLQESSLARKRAIWLGVDEPFDGEPGTRIHLDIPMTRWLLARLTEFVETGHLPELARKETRE